MRRGPHARLEALTVAYLRAHRAAERARADLSAAVVDALHLGVPVNHTIERAARGDQAALEDLCAP